MKKMIPLIHLTARFSEVIRAIGYTKGHLENDAEHSFQLAVVAWSANHQYDLQLSDEKILKYALVHDLVEIYAGDTDAFGDQRKLAQKKEREEKALVRLHKEYSEFQEILQTIERYEEKREPEAMLVNVFDKLIADETIYTSGDDYYVVRKITFQAWKERFLTKIAYQSLPQNIVDIVDESIREIEKRRTIFYE